MNWRLILMMILPTFGACVFFPSTENTNTTIEATFTGDVRLAEKEISILLGYKKSPLPPVSVKYVPSKRINLIIPGTGKIKTVAKYFHNTVYLSLSLYKNRQGFEGGEVRTYFGETVSVGGSVGYYHTIRHEVAHYFFTNLTGWADNGIAWKNGRCGKDNDGRKIANEGFAEAVSFELMMKKSHETGDARFEEFVARSLGYALVWKNATSTNEKIYTLRDYPAMPALSPENTARVNEAIGRYMIHRPKTPCEKKLRQECFSKKYSIGLLEEYRWREKYPNGRWDDGTISEFMCTYNK